MENFVYWFTYHYDEATILENIYILLFFYCFFMIFIKILSILKNNNSKRR